MRRAAGCPSWGESVVISRKVPWEPPRLLLVGIAGGNQFRMGNIMMFHASISRLCARLIGPARVALLTGVVMVAATSAQAQRGPAAPQMREPGATQMQREPASPQAQQHGPAQPRQVRASAEFHAALQPHGRWQQHSRWGEVWIPGNRNRDWRPYTVGRWVYNQDWGWYWAEAQEEAAWGWITYHYGRWTFDREMGWMWIAGDEWGPGFVEWRHGKQYVGWAPMPPDEIIVEYREQPEFWIFVRERDFVVAPRLVAVILPVREYPVFFSETIVVNETVLVGGNFAVNPGIPPTVIAAAIGRPVPTFNVRPMVLAGTAAIAGAMQVRAQDIRSGSFRGQTTVQQAQSTIGPSPGAPQLRALGAGEKGRLGDNPPRAAAAGAAPTTGLAPTQQQPPPQQGQQRQPPAQPRQQQGQQAQPPAQTQGRGAEEQRQQQQRQPQAPQRAQPQQRPGTEGRGGVQPQRQPQTERRGGGATEQARPQRPEPPRATRPEPSAPRATEGRGAGAGAGAGAERQAAPPRQEHSQPGGTVGRGGGGPSQAAPQRGPAGGGGPGKRE